ncbi:Carbonic anhydrase or acetyltransferase, isoleucine patch superfamily [Arthrobacter sp. ov118]|nr:Carbonic anhydrase or acetyltransferase, isoleucine patch superfamily [Arthrobacter sp. ov118]
MQTTRLLVCGDCAVIVGRMTPIYAFAGDAPVVSDDAFVAPTASIIGQAELRPGSSAFYGVTVRADTAPINVGEGTNLQDNVVVHADPGFPCTLGSRVSVGHGAVVHGCTVEDDCLIGMNSTVLNGAVIGANSLVAAGAVVLEGTIVPPKSLVAGVPAKVRRKLSDEEVEGIKGTAARYVLRAAVHRDIHSQA